MSLISRINDLATRVATEFNTVRSEFAALVHTHTASDVTDFDTEVSNNTAVSANTAKVSADGSVTTHSDVSSAGSGAIITGVERTKLNGIATGAEVNTIDSETTGEPTGSDVVLNVVSLTQAEYDAGTPISTTFYIITDA